MRMGAGFPLDRYRLASYESGDEERRKPDLAMARDLFSERITINLKITKH